MVMLDTTQLNNEDKKKVFEILESNFKESLDQLHKYIIYSLVTAVIYLAILITPQKIEIPGVPVVVEGGFAFVMLGAFYIAVGSMAVYTANRAANIGNVLFQYRSSQFEALNLGPSLGVSDIVVVRLIICFVAPTILSVHQAYLGLQYSNGGVILPIIVYLVIGISLWRTIPIRKKSIR